MADNKNNVDVIKYGLLNNNEYNEYLWNHGINPFEKIDEKGNDIEVDPF